MNGTIEGLKTWTLYLKPTYSVFMPTPKMGNRSMSLEQLKNQENLKVNRANGKFSKKSRQRLINSVNWLLASAPKKWVYDKERNKRFKFHVNFITLTLPSVNHDISDHFFKEKLLHGFINSCRYRLGLKNFVWKVEPQANGNIHAHFTTDTFMNWAVVRRIWNKILDTHGLIDLYRNRFSKMSEDEYIFSQSIGNNVDVEVLRKRYAKGVENNWSNPNTTDVHAVYKVNDLAAYLAKYMSKDDEDRREIRGRLWSCSYNISRACKLKVEIPIDAHDNDLNCLWDGGFKKKEIGTIDAITKEFVQFGTVFFYGLNDWNSKITGKIAEIYNTCRYYIRHGLDIESFLNPVYFQPEKVKDTVSQNDLEVIKAKSTQLSAF